jgi:hypothetical protein
MTNLNDFLDLSARDLTDRYASGELTPVEVTEAA